MKPALKQIFEKAIMAGAIGDALGVPFEFNKSEYIDPDLVMTMAGYGTHNQPAGTWSDDTSMTLATISAIENIAKPFPIVKMMENFLLWKTEGEFTAHGKYFDIGNQTSQALLDWKTLKGTRSPAVNENALGNGALMRILPVVFFGYKLMEEAKDFSNISDNFAYMKARAMVNRVVWATHPSNSNAEICLMFAGIVWNLLRGKDLPGLIKAFKLDKQVKDFATLFNQGGHVRDCLLIALYSVSSCQTFKDAVVKAICFGGDTDTNASVTAQLFVLAYPEANIPFEWIDHLQAKDKIKGILDKIAWL